MDKNCTLVLVTNWNACNKIKLEDGKELTKPAKYLGIVLDGSEKVIAIQTFNDFNKNVCEYMAKSIVIGDRDNPQFREPKPKKPEKSDK